MSKLYDENDMKKNLLNKEEVDVEENILQSEALNITWENLNVSLRSQASDPIKPVLQNVSGYARSGSVTAIMGPSGAGKSTMLAMISQRLSNNTNAVIQGQMKLNNGEYNAKIFSKYAALILQDDILLESLTVKETISFAANLKLVTSQQEKDQKVISIIQKLKLQKCKDTPVGGTYIKGISGGQRKRTNIGVELIGDPSLIVLDEPTSGLDSFTAYILINILRNMARKENKTIVMTIHQPSSEIFEMIDHLLLLRNGQCVYQGKASAIVSYMKNLELAVPRFSNPPDFFMKALTADEKSDLAVGLSAMNYQKIQEKETHEEIRKMQGGQPGLFELQSNPIGYEIKQIIKRSFTNFMRNPMYFKSKLGALIFLVILIGSLWWNIGGNIPAQPATIDNNTQFIFNVGGGCFMLGTAIFMSVAMTITLVFPNERAVFLKEENSGMYRVLAYFVGQLSVQLPYVVLFPVLLNVCLYWMINFPPQGFLTQILVSLTANGLGFMNGSVFSDAKIAVAMTPLLIMPFFLFAGFYSNLGTIPDWIGWVQYISPFKYFFNALVLNFFNYHKLQSFNPETNQIEVLDITKSFDDQCLPIFSKSKGFNLTIAECCFVLLGIAIGFHTIAFASLKIQTRKII